MCYEHVSCVYMYLCVVELSASENFTITIVEIVIFTIMNTITMVDLLNISPKNMDF